MKHLLMLSLVVTTAGAMTIAPDVAVDYPAVWWVVIALGGGTVTTIVAVIIRGHRAVRDIWSNR